MKKQLLLLVVISSAIFQFSYTQCERSGTFVQSDPMYSISGTGSITFTTSGDKNVIFGSDFATVQGADLRVYLSKTDDIAATDSEAIQISGQLENDAGGFGGPGTSPISGVMNFTLPTATELSDFDYIVIQCIVINERWGYVSLGSATGTDCASLSLEDDVFSNLTIYPNPAKNEIILENQSSEIVKIEVYDMLGKMAFQKSQQLNGTMDISGLKTGIYLMKINSEGLQTTKRLIIE